MQEFKHLKMEKRYHLYPLVLTFAYLATLLAFIKQLLLGWINIEPQTNSLLFDGLGPMCRKVKEGAKGWQALHILYNFPTIHYESSFIRKLVDKFWLLGLKNPRGVRNRLRIVTDILSKELSQILVKKKSVTIVSLACGSAEATFQAVNSLGKDKNKVTIYLIDQDEEALFYARNEAKKNNIEVTAIKTSVARLRRVIHGKVDIIEMVGLLDYIDNGTATRLFEMIQDCLVPGGIFITANIIPNSEASFLRYCSSWSMIYRQPEELHNLCHFVFGSSTQLFIEPLRIHAICVCRKNNNHDSGNKSIQVL